MSHVTCHMLCVTCHVSHVMFPVSHVTCHMSHVIFFFFGQSGEAYRWRVCYQWGLPRQVFRSLHKTIVFVNTLVGRGSIFFPAPLLHAGAGWGGLNKWHSLNLDLLEHNVTKLFQTNSTVNTKHCQVEVQEKYF